MLCAIFLTDVNSTMFLLPGYQLYCNNRKHCRSGGVALYTGNEFQASFYYTERSYYKS